MEGGGRKGGREGGSESVREGGREGGREYGLSMTLYLSHSAQVSLLDNLCLYLIHAPPCGTRYGLNEQGLPNP